MTDTNDLLNGLNPQQSQAVTAGLGQVLVLAGPGSGKTRVLTNRFAFLIRAMGVRPYNILAVTFTNKAAREMENRLEKLLGEQVRAGLWLGTFHSVCARILRREADYLPVKSNFVIMDSDDQETLVRRILKEYNLDEKLYRPASIHGAISTAKNNLILPKSYPARSYREEIVARVYGRYQELLEANNSLDFDDLLVMCVRLLDENPQVREKYAQRFEHVLVDEFQDTNSAQYELLRQLSSFHGNLFAVGDEDQSIYRWRGADYRNVQLFEKDNPKAQKILLEQNYRSTQTVLDAARAVIDQNSNRTPKKLFSDRGRGEKITLYDAIDDHAEADYVVDTIQQSMATGTPGGDFAVMYRTNGQSRLLEEAFLRSGVPYRLVGAQRFYGRREIKDLIAYLRLVSNPADELSLLRAINVPPRGIGDKTIVALQLCAQRANLSAGDILLDLGRKGDQSSHWASFSGRGASILADFGAMLSDWQSDLEKTTLPALFDRILVDIGYQLYIDDGSEEGNDRWSNVQELQSLAYEYEERGLTAFLENLALVSDQDTIPTESNVPTLMTLHAAKGLEFPQVFISGMDEGLLPHSRSLDDPEEMAEERRLFYVGLTRARNRLYLVRADRRSTYGSFQDSVQSRFLEDIPEELIKRQGIKRYMESSSSSDWNPREIRKERYARWESTPPANLSQAHASRAARPQKGNFGRGMGQSSNSDFGDKFEQPVKPAPIISEPSYKAGSRVRHPSWGEGLVIQDRILDGEEIVDVAFESVGFKRLMAALAKLEVIG
ncbi:MAG: UvrD-helicase domain-containing protein [Anaerolineaceae bacterium]|nr:UvrD-helicase domain-containing protein [Anaerolineaceae bacterium]